MIKPEELRIGNWVKCVGPDEKRDCSEVHQIDLDFLTVICHNDLKIYGIPLTPELLESAGFETLRHSGEYWLHFKNKNGWYISQWISDEQMAGFEEKGVFYWSDNYVPVHYLHELQNLYYILNRKELEINL